MVTEEEMKNMSPEEIQELQKKNCVFCHMTEGKVDCKKIYDDDKVMGILDINPASPGHVLLIPMEHYVIMPQLPEDLIQHMFIVAKKISHNLLKGLKVKGTNIFIANGAVAGQKAPHFIMHIIPRDDGDGVNFMMPGKELTPEKTKEIYNKLTGKEEADRAPPEPQESTNDALSDDDSSQKDKDDAMDYDALKKAIDNGM